MTKDVAAWLVCLINKMNSLNHHADQTVNSGDWGQLWISGGQYRKPGGTILRNKNHPDYDDNENLKAKHQLNQRTEFSLRILTVLINVAFAAKMCVYLTYGQILTKLLQLDCPWVTTWDLVGTTSQLGPISNLRPFLDSSAQTTRGNVLDFFCKT